MIRERIGPILYDFLQKRAKKKLQRVSNGELYGRIEDYTRATTSTGCSWADYWLLYSSVRTYKPQEFLECGTGVSTLVIAHALKENGSGRVTSMEEHRGWYEMAQKLLPAPYAAIVDLRLSETVQDGHAMFRGIRYKDIPQRAYDFVFVDGPEEANGLTQKESADLDFIHILRTSNHSIRGIVDSRTGTFFTLSRILGRENVRFNYVLRQGIILPCTAASIRDARHIASDDLRAHAYKRPWKRTFTSAS